jgi:hypothetical protein
MEHNHEGRRHGHTHGSPRNTSGARNGTVWTWSPPVRRWASRPAGSVFVAWRTQDSRRPLLMPKSAILTTLSLVTKTLAAAPAWRRTRTHCCQRRTLTLDVPVQHSFAVDVRQAFEELVHEASHVVGSHGEPTTFAEPPQVCLGIVETEEDVAFLGFVDRPCSALSGPRKWRARGHAPLSVTTSRRWTMFLCRSCWSIRISLRATRENCNESDEAQQHLSQREPISPLPKTCRSWSS